MESLIRQLISAARPGAALPAPTDVKDSTPTAPSQTEETYLLNYQADDVYLDVGGTGTVTATADGKTSTYQISGAPNIYTVVSRTSQERATLFLSLSPGLSAYSFTFG